MISGKLLGPAGAGAYKLTTRTARGRFLTVVACLLCAVVASLAAAYAIR
jgi:hypothetical protein